MQKKWVSRLHEPTFNFAENYNDGKGDRTKQQCQADNIGKEVGRYGWCVGSGMFLLSNYSSRS